MDRKEIGPLRGPLAFAAWFGATAAAVAVAWLGLDSVLAQTVQPPPAVLAAGTARAAGAVSSTTAVLPAPSPSATTAKPSSPPAPAHASKTDGAPPSSSAPPQIAADDKVSRYETGGGVVVLSIGTSSVTLVSATPATGYSVQEWQAAGWLRVDFTQGSTVYSVYATWNGYSPQVQVVGPS